MDEFLLAMATWWYFALGADGVWKLNGPYDPMQCEGIRIDRVMESKPNTVGKTCFFHKDYS